MSVVERARWAVRRGLAPIRLRPTFLVVGAQRSGTTSLHRYLDAHPAVVCATPKEVHYFDLYHERSAAWYLAHFAPTTREVGIRRRTGVPPAVCEVTPRYLFDPRVADHVHRFHPELKLVAIVRDPAARAYSQYQMQVQMRGETLSFEEALEQEQDGLDRDLSRMREDPTYGSTAGRLRRSYLAGGRYAEQLEASARRRLAEVFAPENRRVEELLGRTLPWADATEAAPVARETAP